MEVLAIRPEWADILRGFIMAKINRQTGNVVPFANNALAGEFYEFGSSTDQNQDLDSLVNSNYLRGWGIVGSSAFPPFEWFNAMGFTLGQYISYLHQMGVAEWDIDQEYPTKGSLTNHNNRVWIRTDTWSLGDEPVFGSTSWMLLDPVYQLVVSQYANGNYLNVSYIEAGINVSSYDFFIYESKSLVFEKNKATGAFAGDFNPSTGADSGISGVLRQIDHATPTDMCQTSGTVDAIVLSSLGAKRNRFTTGDKVRFYSAGANTGATTISLDSLTAQACITISGTALPAGYIRNGFLINATWNGAAWVISREEEVIYTSTETIIRKENGVMEITAKWTLGGDNTYTYSIPFSSIPRPKGGAGFVDVIVSGNEAYMAYVSGITAADIVWRPRYINYDSVTPVTQIGIAAQNFEFTMLGRWYEL